MSHSRLRLSVESFQPALDWFIRPLFFLLLCLILGQCCFGTDYAAVMESPAFHSRCGWSDNAMTSAPPSTTGSTEKGRSSSLSSGKASRNYYLKGGSGLNSNYTLEVQFNVHLLRSKEVSLFSACRVAGFSLDRASALAPSTRNQSYQIFCPCPLGRLRRKKRLGRGRFSSGSEAKSSIEDHIEFQDPMPIRSCQSLGWFQSHSMAGTKTCVFTIIAGSARPHLMSQT